MTSTINTLPSAGSLFMETLLAFLSQEDAERFMLQFRGFVWAGGIHGTVAGLTGTPSALTAWPGGYYTTEAGSITYANASTTWVIADSGLTGNIGGYTRVAGTHYLTAVVDTALPTGTIRLMKVTTAGGAITAVEDQRQLSPLVNRAATPYLRLIGTEASAADLRIVEDAGLLQVHKNTATEDQPVWALKLAIAFAAVGSVQLVEGVTAARVQTFPDKDGTFAMLSDISAGSFDAGTRMYFDQGAAPTGWTRDVTASLNDRAIRIVTGARTPNGGDWAITGMSVTLGAHWHEVPINLDGTVPEAVPLASWPPGSSGTTRTTMYSNAAAGAGLNRLTSKSGDPVSTSAQVVSSDGTWRPLYRDCICAQKN